ncbi:MAG: hypothetical protein ABIP54_00620 [Candidatus Andersenbacteria bacterium]
MPRQIITNRPILTLGGQNLMTYSNDLSAWSNQNAPVTVNQHINPRTGLLTMDEIADDGATNHHKRNLIVPTIQAFEQFTLSMLVRNNTRRYMGFYLDSGSTNVATFDLLTGVVSLASIATQMFSWVASIDEVFPDNTYRVKLTFATRIPLVGASISIYCHDAGNVYHFYAGDGSSVFVDEIQMNKGNDITPYKATSGSASTNPVRSLAPGRAFI